MAVGVSPTDLSTSETAEIFLHSDGMIKKRENIDWGLSVLHYHVNMECFQDFAEFVPQERQLWKQNRVQPETS